ncbi:MAG: rhodanese-like domain-containing protein [Gammaproteobacteria bacterium]|jgi:rhodanese-related sulfurtransferase|nr:rhodanese-like domain-containing protein [Gammaproteobacteria bacterium]MBT5222870.1 rhodanese-like domain-containing protein [Gammaproteobacteria bacterium]MBT5824973.1 rhodanese-like domain-containing protein [Gammaproteobacteria bacterium]MBT6419319.1 rhodanese-like domain-containing protein [Gammaproteobacteria bacterium]MBT6576625.1 rhodanese-like domain-containing protein [Gammaproteobacteria bacterium]
MKLPLLFILLANFFMAECVSAKSPAPEQVNGAVTVSTKYAKKLLNQGVTFIDVRRATDYQASHIQGAHHLDLKLDLTEGSLLAVIKKNRPVVFYCNGDMCQRSALASEKAVAWGWANVFYYRGGFPDWKKAGLPLK